MGDRLPPLLTVEEAARLIRVGRTKAYAMSREWRATIGRSGLPVVDFGDVLRVPTAQLEALIGSPLDQFTVPAPPSAEDGPGTSIESVEPHARPARRGRRQRRRPSGDPAGQLPLFGDKPRAKP